MEAWGVDQIANLRRNWGTLPVSLLLERLYLWVGQLRKASFGTRPLLFVPLLQRHVAHNFRVGKVLSEVSS